MSISNAGGEQLENNEVHWNYWAVILKTMIYAIAKIKIGKQHEISSKINLIGIY